MRTFYRLSFFAIFVLLSGCQSKFKDYSLLKEEFDICPYWYDNMTWQKFLNVRNNLRREGLIKYVDKIEQQKIAKEHGLEVPKTYIATREKTPIIDLLTPLSSYVAKVTHMSLSQGLIVVKNGVDLVTGKPVTPNYVQDQLFKYMDKKPRGVESWALHHVQPGFMIQEYIPNRQEVKIQCIWGKAVIGEWRGGEGQNTTTPVWGRYDRDGNLADLDSSRPAPSWWPQAIAAAEKVAQKIDALRVDFLVRENNELLLNELEIWPESNWKSKQSLIEQKLNDGYRNMCE